MLSVAFAVVRIDGEFVPKSCEGINSFPTARTVSSCLHLPKHPTDQDFALKAHYTPTDADKEKAADCIEWLRTKLGCSDYESNLRVLATSDGIEQRREAYLVSAVACYKRHLGEALRKASRQVCNEWFGKPGDKVQLDLTVTKAIVVDGFYGATTIVIMLDAEGRTYKWNASGRHELEEGSLVRIKGTIKNHSIYKETKQTVLTRCKYEAKTEEAA